MPAAHQPPKLLRTWDGGSRSVRVKILQNFVADCNGMSAPQLERELGNSASLLLARVSSWLRLTYALGQPVALQLRAVRIFVGASSGQRFLAEYVEVGGLATLVEIIALKQLSDDDKTETLLLLQAVADAGRHYKEVLCEAGLVPALERFMCCLQNDALLELASAVLISLGRANPAYAGPTHAAYSRGA